jgi:hypothetical protein
VNLGCSDFLRLHIVLAENRIKREQIGSSVVVEKLNKRGIHQGLGNLVVIAIAFTFLLNTISVQGESASIAKRARGFLGPEEEG